MGEERPFRFRYAGGAFVADESLPVTSDGLEAAGYSESQTVGEGFGIHYTLYEKACGDSVVSVGTLNQWCFIRCGSWPDLIDLLAKLSPVAMAAILGEEELQAVRELLEPTVRELRRRKRSGGGPRA